LFAFIPYTTLFQSHGADESLHDAHRPHLSPPLRTGAVLGSRGVATYHLPLATPSLRSGGGTTPHTPERRRTGVLSGSRPSENRGCSRIASAPAASSDFRLPTRSEEHTSELQSR